MLLEIGLLVTTHEGSVNEDPGAKVKKARQRCKVLNAEVFNPKVGRRSYMKWLLDTGN